MDSRTAYQKGWDASRRTQTCDLEAAENRFTARYGGLHAGSFVDGWTDHASDIPHRHNDPEAYQALWANAVRSETRQRTARICGIDPTEVPDCVYCDEPLTDNEWDAEPGAIGGFFSAHSGCRSTNPEGHFVVTTDVKDPALRTNRYTGNQDYPHSRRFTTRKRAEGEVEYLRLSNPEPTVFTWTITESTPEPLFQVVGLLHVDPEEA